MLGELRIGFTFLDSDVSVKHCDLSHHLHKHFAKDFSQTLLCIHSEKRVMSRRVSGPCLTHPMSETSWTLTWHGDMDVPRDMSRHL